MWPPRKPAPPVYGARRSYGRWDPRGKPRWLTLCGIACAVVVTMFVMATLMPGAPSPRRPSVGGPQTLRGQRDSGVKRQAGLSARRAAAAAASPDALDALAMAAHNEWAQSVVTAWRTGIAVDGSNTRPRQGEYALQELRRQRGRAVGADGAGAGAGGAAVPAPAAPDANGRGDGGLGGGAAAAAALFGTAPVARLPLLVAMAVASADRSSTVDVLSSMTALRKRAHFAVVSYTGEIDTWEGTLKRAEADGVVIVAASDSHPADVSRYAQAGAAPLLDVLESAVVTHAGKYDRVWLVNDNVRLGGVNLDAYLDTLACVSGDPSRLAVLSQPAVSGGLHRAALTSYETWAHADIPAVSSKLVDQTAPMFDADFLLWFIRYVWHKSSDDPRLTTPGAHLVWCAAAEVFAATVLPNPSATAAANAGGPGGDVASVGTGAAGPQCVVVTATGTSVTRQTKAFDSAAEVGTRDVVGEGPPVVRASKVPLGAGRDAEARAVGLYGALYPGWLAGTDLTTSGQFVTRVFRRLCAGADGGAAAAARAAAYDASDNIDPVAGPAAVRDVIPVVSKIYYINADAADSDAAAAAAGGGSDSASAGAASLTRRSAMEKALRATGIPYERFPAVYPRSFDDLNRRFGAQLRSFAGIHLDVFGYNQELLPVTRFDVPRLWQYHPRERKSHCAGSMYVPSSTYAQAMLAAAAGDGAAAATAALAGSGGAGDARAMTATAGDGDRRAHTGQPWGDLASVLGASAALGVVGNALSHDMLRQHIVTHHVPGEFVLVVEDDASLFAPNFDAELAQASSRLPLRREGEGPGAVWDMLRLFTLQFQKFPAPESACADTRVGVTSDEACLWYEPTLPLDTNAFWSTAAMLYDVYRLPRVQRHMHALPLVPADWELASEAPGFRTFTAIGGSMLTVDESLHTASVIGAHAVDRPGPWTVDPAACCGPVPTKCVCDWASTRSSACTGVDASTTTAADGSTAAMDAAAALAAAQLGRLWDRHADGPGGDCVHTCCCLRASGQGGVTATSAPVPPRLDTLPGGQVRPFFLIGCQKCMSTLVWDLLLKSPHIAAAVEPQGAGWDDEGGRMFRENHFLIFDQRQAHDGVVTTNKVKEPHYLDDPPVDAEGVVVFENADDATDAASASASASAAAARDTDVDSAQSLLSPGSGYPSSKAAGYITPLYATRYFGFFPQQEAALAEGRQLPLLSVDASPGTMMSAAAPLRLRNLLTHSSQAVAGLSVMAGDGDADQVRGTRFVAVLRDPVNRATSDFRMFHRSKHVLDFEASTREQIAQISMCKAKYAAAPEGWWAACKLLDGIGGEFVSYDVVWNGLYAEQLRHWYCVMIANGGRGAGPGACFDWDDPAAAGVLSPARQSQLLVLVGESIGTAPSTTANEVLRFVGLPELAPRPGMEAPAPYAFKGSDTSHVPDSVLTTLAEFYREDQAHLRLMLGWDPGFEWFSAGGR